jgi:hypothetical protein
MKKQVYWDSLVKDTIIKRWCLCEGCSYCKHQLDKKNMYCYKFGQYRCEECNDYRCVNCVYTKIVTMCNYCMRIV